MFASNQVRSLFALSLFSALSVGCGTSDPTGSGGEGSISFTTWGEEYIEDEIPADSSEITGFVDGRSLSRRR